METNQNKLNWTLLTCFEYTNVECKDNIPLTRNKIASGTQHSKQHFHKWVCDGEFL